MRKTCSLAAFATLFAAAGWPSPAAAKVSLPAVFGNHMVLQCDMPIPVWGWADRGEVVTVTLDAQSRTVTASQSGEWAVKLDATGARRTAPTQGPRQDQHAPTERRVGRRGLALLRTVEHGNARLAGRRRRSRQDRRSPDPHACRPSAIRPPGRKATAARLARLLPRSPHPQRHSRLLRRGLFLRPRVAQAAGRAHRLDPHLPRQHADRGLDQHRGEQAVPELRPLVKKPSLPVRQSAAATTQGGPGRPDRFPSTSGPASCTTA